MGDTFTAIASVVISLGLLVDSLVHPNVRPKEWWAPVFRDRAAIAVGAAVGTFFIAKALVDGSWDGSWFIAALSIVTSLIFGAMIAAAIARGRLWLAARRG